MEKKEICIRECLDVVDIICDCCGKSCSKGDYGYEFLKLSASWGYTSKKDLEKWEAHLCEDCVDATLGFIKFNISNSLLNT